MPATPMRRSFPMPMDKSRFLGPGREVGRKAVTFRRQAKPQADRSASPAAPVHFKFIEVMPGSEDVKQSPHVNIHRHVIQRRSQHKARPCRKAITADHLERRWRTDVVDAQFVPKYPFNLHQISGVDPFDRAPIRLEPYMHDLLIYFSTTMWKQFYTLERLAGSNPVTEYWLPLAFQDPALIHSYIGCADAYISGYASVTDRLRGLRHLQEAISIVNRRIVASEDAVSGGIATIVAIAGIAMLEKGAGNHDHWYIHMQGLKKLVDLHGGLESLQCEPIVLNKIYRTDLYGSLDITYAPFFADQRNLLTKLPPLKSYRSTGFRNLHKLFLLDDIIHSCIYHLEEVSLFWGQYPAQDEPQPEQRGTIRMPAPTATEAALVRQAVTKIRYTLVSDELRKRLSCDQAGQVAEICRIGLIFYSLSILNEWAPLSSFGQHIGTKLRNAFDSYKGTTATADTSIASAPISSAFPPTELGAEFQLWTVFMAATVMMSTKCEIQDWLLTSFSELCSPKFADIHDWCDLRRRLCQYLWVPSLHDAAAKTLWLLTAGLQQA
ncbi:hypothetical protein BX600DRAFT_514483 [Xylariales sp. PMI_506]|nr:hypothetical protein BX600DRAFT_514483 [Xylariales sp. PMI_506]